MRVGKLERLGGLRVLVTLGKDVVQRSVKRFNVVSSPSSSRTLYESQLEVV